MKEEKQVQDITIDETKVTEVPVAIQSDGEVVQVEDKSDYIVIPDMFVSRKVTRKKDKEYNDYTVYGRLRGVDVQVKVRPGRDGTGFADVSAYSILNIVFGNNSDVPFAVQKFERKDYKSGRIISRGMTYFAYVKDVVDGEEYTAPLRFETTSDKALISKLVEVSNRKNGLGLD